MVPLSHIYNVILETENNFDWNWHLLDWPFIYYCWCVNFD